MTVLDRLRKEIEEVEAELKATDNEINKLLEENKSYEDAIPDTSRL